MARRRAGILYLLFLGILIAALAWPAFVLASTALGYYSGESWQLDAWNLEPKRLMLQRILSGYQHSLIFALPVGLVAIIDYLLLSRYRVTWIIGGILLPAAGMALAFLFYQEPMTALPSLVLAGLILALVYRFSDGLRRLFRWN